MCGNRRGMRPRARSHELDRRSSQRVADRGRLRRPRRTRRRRPAPACKARSASRLPTATNCCWLSVDLRWPRATARRTRARPWSWLPDRDPLAAKLVELGRAVRGLAIENPQRLVVEGGEHHDCCRCPRAYAARMKATSTPDLGSAMSRAFSPEPPSRAPRASRRRARGSPGNAARRSSDRGRPATPVAITILRGIVDCSIHAPRRRAAGAPTSAFRAPGAVPSSGASGFARRDASMSDSRAPGASASGRVDAH